MKGLMRAMVIACALSAGIAHAQGKVTPLRGYIWDNSVPGTCQFDTQVKTGGGASGVVHATIVGTDSTYNIEVTLDANNKWRYIFPLYTHGGPPIDRTYRMWGVAGGYDLCERTITYTAGSFVCDLKMYEIISK